MQIREIRFSGLDEDNLFKSQALYEKYRRGEELSSHEARFLTPSREMLLHIYGFVKSYKVWSFDVESMLVRSKIPTERLCTLLIAIDVLCELALIKIEQGKIIFDGEGKKADLTKSEILNRLNQLKGE